MGVCQPDITDFRGVRVEDTAASIFVDGLEAASYIAVPFDGLPDGRHQSG